MWGNLNDTVESTSGGFMNDSRAGTTGENKKNVKRGQNIVPVMIRHLTSCNGELNVWGMTVQTVTFVGILRRVEQATTKTTYEIEDETDKITAFRWLEAGQNLSVVPIELNSYVRVFGHLREQNEKKHVLISKICAITDLNELTNHLLEVTYVSLKAEERKNGGNDKFDANKSNDVPMTDDLIGLTKEQAEIFKTIEAENDSENGIERSVLKMRVPKNILPRVDEIIDFLTSEGHIYTTLTDDHFKTT